MYEVALDRRRHKHFRVIYMDFRSFWNRYILRKKPVPKPRPAPRAIRPQAEEPTGKVISTGIPKIDEQHLAIRSAILELQKEIRSGLAGMALTEPLDDLIRKAQEHFRFEEAYRERRGYPQLAEHRAEHDEFRTRILQLRDRAEVGDPSASLELSTFLFNWLRLHILRDETALSRSRHYH